MSSKTSSDLDGILNVLEKLKKHSAIVVEWLDASESDVCDINTAVLPNAVVVTHITEIGWFIKVQSDTTWHMPYLLYYFRTTDRRYRISSIPLPLVKRVVPLEEKMARKHGLVSLNVSVSPRSRRRIQRFEGGVKCPRIRARNYAKETETDIED